MGTGYVRNDTANSIANGNVIDADALDGEFNAVETAFNSSTGHSHDGTAANGAPITKVGPTQDVVVSASLMYPRLTNTVSLGSATLKFKDGYIDGVLYADDITLNGTAITATAAELNVLDGILASTTELNYVDGVTSAIQTQLDNKQPLNSGLTAIGGLAKTDSNIIVGDGTTWVAESGATARASLGVSIGSQVQAWDVNLDQIAALSPADNYFIVGDGTAWTAESPVNALVSLGVTSTAAELNVLDGITATTTELNVLHGIPATLTATELGYMDGVTSAVQTQLNTAGTSKVTVLTSGTGATFTKDADTKQMKVTVVGAGGGGGGVDGQGAGTAGVGGCGAGGAAAIKWIQNPSATYTYNIGAGGAGGAAGQNAGASGGTSTFSGGTVTISAAGGDGAAGDLAATGVSFGTAASGGAVASGGDINIKGGAAIGGLATGTIYIPGVSGVSIFGGAQRGSYGGGAGLTGGAPGAGGAGATVDGVATNFAGGAGADGIIIVEEFK